MLLSVELCSLTVQREPYLGGEPRGQRAPGDGAAAVVMVGSGRSGSRALPRVLATRSRLYPDSERAMGWDVGATGLRIVLGVEVPDLVRANLRDDVDRFLGGHGLTREDIGWWWPRQPQGPRAVARHSRWSARRLA